MLVFGGLAVLILLVAVTDNFYAYGVFGASLILLVVVLAILWYRDRGQVESFGDTKKI